MPVNAITSLIEWCFEEEGEPDVDVVATRFAKICSGTAFQRQLSNEGELITAAVVALREKKLAELKAKMKLGIEQIERGECVDLDDDAAIEAFFDSLERDSQAILK